LLVAWRLLQSVSRQRSHKLSSHIIVAMALNLSSLLLAATDPHICNLTEKP
jgi:hypothetical protein